MKKTYFLTMLAAALLGGQVFAADVTGTSVVGYDPDLSKDKNYYGKYSDTESVSGGDVTVKADDQGTVDPNADVYGGYTEGTAKSAFNNKVTITGGTVWMVFGGSSQADGIANVTHNTITMTGGTVVEIVAGRTRQGDATNNTVSISGGTVTSTVFSGYTEDGNANGNYIEMTGGTVGGLQGGTADAGKANENVVIVKSGIVEEIFGGVSFNEKNGGGEASRNKVYVTGTSGGGISLVGGGFCSNNDVKGTVNNNEVHLVGAGADIMIGGKNYTGSELQLGTVYAGRGDITEGNSIDIYGSGITAGSLQDMQELNFHMLAASAKTDTAIVTLTSMDSGSALVLGPELELNFDAMGAMTWQPGDSVTLVSSALGITVDDSLLSKEYDIYQYGTPEQAFLVGTAKLKLEQSNTILKLTVETVPEPATGTLSLLALAGLCARRRRK